MSPLVARVLLPLYLLAIYGTLGVARTVTETLRASGYLRVTVVTAFALAAATALFLVFRDALNRSPRVMAMLAGSGALYAAIIFPMESPEEKLHFIEYGLVALLAHAALPAKLDRWRRFAAAAVITAAAGWVDEGIQGLLPTRHYDLRDVGFNALAGVIALAVLGIVRTGRQRAAALTEAARAATPASAHDR